MCFLDSILSTIIPLKRQDWTTWTPFWHIFAILAYWRHLVTVLKSKLSNQISKVILYAAPFFCLPRQLDMRGSGNPSVSKIVACLGVKKIR